MTAVDRRSQFCILGAGASGIAVCKNFRERNIPFECLEREDDIGGTWYFGRGASAVYASTHLISSKRQTEFADFPMPSSYPPYPSHRQACDYLRDYARHFGLYEHIQFGRTIERIERVDDKWHVRFANGEERVYRGVVIANGHNWDPRRPTYPGAYDGVQLHSSQYKTPDVLAGRRVLVVGAGNSGCDIAVEAAQHAAATFHSTRRGYHYLPKFLFGKPADSCGELLLRWRFPLWLRRMISARLVKLALGRPEDYGLPAPDHKLFETHPIVNSQMLYYVGHGRIAPRPDVGELCGNGVRFVDGRREQIDVIVYATGFKISFPFIDVAELNWNGERPELYLHAFHPQRDDLFVAGMIQPDSGQWGIVDVQAQLIARFINACDRGDPRAAEFRRRKANPHADLGHGIRYVPSSRHLLEVEHFSYRRTLEKLVAGLS